MKNKRNLFVFVIALLVFLVAPSAYAEGFVCDKDTRDVLSIVNTAINFIKIVVPVIIVVLAMVDVFKVVTNGKADEGERKKAFTTLATRFVLGVLIFFIPQIVKILFKAIVPNADATKAIECTLDGSSFNDDGTKKTSTTKKVPPKSPTETPLLN